MKQSFITIIFILLVSLSCIKYIYYDLGFGSSITQDNVTIEVVASEPKPDGSYGLKISITNYSRRIINFVCIKGYFHNIDEPINTYKKSEICTINLPCIIKNEEKYVISDNTYNYDAPANEFRIVSVDMTYDE